MKKILVCLPSLTDGDGIAKFYINYYNNIVKNGYIVDFLCVSHDKYSEKILKNVEKSKIFIIPNHNFFSKWIVMNDYLKKEFKESSYDIIHNNLTDANALIINSFFKKRGVQIILHVHNPISKEKKLINLFLFKIAIKKSDYLCACSESAGKSVFKNKKFDIIKNKIDVNRFKFSEESRVEVRKKLNISDDCILIGSVGRVCNQKNPILVYKILSKLSKNMNCKSVWIGNGELEDYVKKYVKKNNIEDKCIFIDSAINIEEFYSAMDVFLLPSKYEGFGIVFIEAQISGLEVVTSDKVPNDVCITDLIHKLNLNEDIYAWIEEIENIVRKHKVRENYYKKIDRTDFNLKKDDDITKMYNKILFGEK